MPIQNKATPILVPYPDWDKSADSLKWLDPQEYKRQILLSLWTLHNINGQTKIIADLLSEGIADTEEIRFTLLNCSEMLTDMWRGYEWYLALYGMKLLSRRPNWKHEIYADPTSDIAAEFQKAYILADKVKPPYWFGEKTLHESHQSWLIRRDSLYKRTFNEKIAKAAHLLPLCWPPYEEGKIKPISP